MVAGRRTAGIDSVFLGALSLLAMACATKPRPEPPAAREERPAYDRDMGGYPEKVEPQESGYARTGMISYYADKFHGKQTASGARFDKNALTAAHRSLPFGTRLRVTNLENGKSVIVVVNDRGPFAHGRILDLSEAAAREIGMLGTGTAKAKIEVL
jgi:rare lipoprotein A